MKFKKINKYCYELHYVKIIVGGITTIVSGNWKKIIELKWAFSRFEMK